MANTKELARHIITSEQERPHSTVPEEDYELLQAQLHHTHLPRLRDYGLVDYDERNKDVRLTDPPQTFMVLLRFCQLVEE